jgi:IclR family pca regulon transcriptional regulator
LAIERGTKAADLAAQGAARKYRLQLGVTDLGMSALNSTGLREHAHPYLKELRVSTFLSTGLGVLDGDDVLYLDRVPGIRHSWDEIDLGLRPGSRVPAYCTAIGKLLWRISPSQRETRWCPRSNSRNIDLT